MTLSFTKMHGAGNDFVMLNGVTQSINLTAAHYRALADRHFGIGADQVLLVESPQPGDDDDIDFRYRIFNADGNEVEHCGNGARCFVRFVRDQGLTSKHRLKVKTVNGIVEPEMLEDGLVRVNMSMPRFDPSDVPFDAGGLQPVESGAGQTWPLMLGGSLRQVAVVSMGNPHAVQIVEDVDTAPVLTEGPQTVAHQRFPEGVNAGFMQIVNRGEVRLRVFERGAGETLACGTGACAAMALGVRLGLLDPVVRLHARGGDLQLEWQGGPQDSIWMSGNAVRVFESSIDPDALLQKQ